MSENSDPHSLHDNAIAYFFISLVVLGLMWLFWFVFQTEIRDVIRWIRFAQMWIMQWFLPDSMTFSFRGESFNWHEGLKTTPNWEKTELTNNHLGFFNAMTMPYLRYIFTALCGAAAIWAYKKGPRSHNRDALSLEGLIAYQAQNFPTITPFITFNPSKQPARPPGSPVPAELPHFAEALGPEEWVAYNSVSTPDKKLDPHSAGQAFKQQLIGRWRGAKHLKPHQKILLAAFCLKASRKRTEADALLGRLAKCWSHDKGLRLKRDKGLLTEAQTILRTKKLAEKTLKQASQHAFVTTAMLRALQYAREEGGVLAPAQFVWLRGYDRTLYYPLNNLGRQSFHMEALGAMSHFKSERLTRRPVPTPKIENAVGTISDYMSSIDARPIPPLDHSKSKRKAIKKAL